MKSLDQHSYLLRASLDDEYLGSSEFPYNLPPVQHLDNISFNSSVTFIVGENGSGKSTVVEALAVGFGFNAEGGSRNFNFATKNTHSPLHEHLRLVRGVKRPKDGFFLRAESFYNVSTNIDSLEEGAPAFVSQYGGKSLHAQSHGESFMSLIRHRFRGEGLYILDEPEAALSISRQLEFLALIQDLVKKNSQFIIATHSPIILSYPGATIYQLDEQGVHELRYEDTQQYQLTRYFLNNYQTMLGDVLGRR